MTCRYLRTLRYTPVMRLLVLVLVALCVEVGSAAAQEPVLWTAEQLAQAQAKAKNAIDPTFHRGVQRLTDSATLIYRDGPSEAEAHTDRADFIVVREGVGTMIIGGTIIEGRASGVGEIRGKAIDGGMRYRMAAGDSLYIPINVAHQFLVEPGQHLVTVIVKTVSR
jgi:mannose-6-phosphate isomerase-like protein (cupin superfamily)